MKMIFVDENANHLNVLSKNRFDFLLVYIHHGTSHTKYEMYQYGGRQIAAKRLFQGLVFQMQ